mmetsp:Transcript_27509/g.33650  ORF Transcript_27509/g.33650 Transcript_27509/m.33650 type:complete len:566 (-) Transcript_27509:493-2190(-)|eukprot:CAMPEP_0204832190 /NCGR_PEP_ID=MMETSP1346-20131115/12866_1 /ASSEMBLY_ACC=CAM_ASM_000771 /TAXON_ID=215587 /ORGANISM="Aplanochytrium stocchinoi, Strain GSBS06" /LENGTH=565 /DNA_ID=CAMNT_0051963833 /DNA_START=33 /DNA_END=1730 /DNA_ORIENTATION=-
MATASPIIAPAGSNMDMPMVVCCVCGVSMKPNQANTCAACLQNQYDITEGVSKNGVLLKCKGCERYQKDTIGWLDCKPESKELLALCLRKTKGLKYVKLVDACFIWTEPHSKRVKVKLQMQKEVVNGVILQETCVVEFVVQNRMCENCHAAEANLTWNSVVQVRQKVEHKRTFLYLEQLIIKHREYERTLKIEPMPYGVNFYFGARNDAVRFADFLESVVPARSKCSKKIISADTKSNIATFNHTFSVDIVPLCKDDFVCLPKVTAMKLGNISQLLICLSVSSTVRLIDPVTCQICELDNQKYWKNTFHSIINASYMAEFTVLDVQLVEIETQEKYEKQEAIAQRSLKKKRKRGSKKKGTGPHVAGAKTSSKHSLAQVEIARTSDLGVNDIRYTVFTHLGRILKPGDSALGYDLTRVNINENDLKDLRKNVEIPDIILIRKHYPLYRKSQKRAWKLKSLAADAPDTPGVIVGATKDDYERDHELFMRDIEEDEEIRGNVNVFKDEEQLKRQQDSSKSVHFNVEGEEIEEDAPMIGIEQMLNDMKIDLPYLGAKPADAEEDELADL